MRVGTVSDLANIKNLTGEIFNEDRSSSYFCFIGRFIEIGKLKDKTLKEALKPAKPEEKLPSKKDCPDRTLIVEDLRQSNQNQTRR